MQLPQPFPQLEPQLVQLPQFEQPQLPEQLLPPGQDEQPQEEQVPHPLVPQRPLVQDVPFV